MDAPRSPRFLLCLLFGLLLVQSAFADADKEVQPVSPPPQPAATMLPSAAAKSVEELSAHYPHATINSLEMAQQAQVDVNSVRAMLATQFSAAKNSCYERFFTNLCINTAQETQRAGLAVLRPIELEAAAYLRQARVDKRDEALEALRIKSEATAQERLKLRQENEKEAARKAETRSSDDLQRQTGQASRPSVIDNRVQQHEEKLQRLREDDASKAQERAKNIADYEEKQRVSAERQKSVAAKKAEKQAKQAGKTSAAEKPMSPVDVVSPSKPK